MSECDVCASKHAHHHTILNKRSPETNPKLHVTIINGVIGAGLMLIVNVHMRYTIDCFSSHFSFVFL